MKWGNNLPSCCEIAVSFLNCLVFYYRTVNNMLPNKVESQFSNTQKRKAVRMVEDTHPVVTTSPNYSLYHFLVWPLTFPPAPPSGHKNVVSVIKSNKQIIMLPTGLTLLLPTLFHHNLYWTKYQRRQSRSSIFSFSVPAGTCFKFRLVSLHSAASKPEHNIHDRKSVNIWNIL